MLVIKKRGLSPVVATVLLIALAMVLAMIIFLWARGWMFEQIEKRGESIDRSCEQVNMEVDLQKTGSQEIKIRIINRGTIAIQAVEIRQEYRGDSSMTLWNITAPPAAASSERTIPLENSNIDKITIYPRLVGTVEGTTDHKAKTCLNHGKTYTI